MALVGLETPRLSTPPVRRLTRRSTLGYEFIEFCETFLGLELLPWQHWWALRALEVDSNGGFVRRVVVTLVARQCGKTTLLKALALWMLYLGRARLVLGAAQSLDIARESWAGAVELAEADPELRAEIDNVRRANGEQCLTLTNGSRYRITAATRSAGRGLSVDLLILDELREHRDWLAWGALSKTTMARPNSLIVAISNAGDDESAVLNQLRDTALAGTDDTIAIYEWSALDGCDLDDPQAWRQAIPGLGYTISEGAVRSALATDPPGVFRTELLCQRVTALDGAVDTAAWRDCSDPAATMDAVRGRVTACLDVAPDGRHVTLVAAALRDDDRVQVEVVAAWDSTAAARKELPALVERVNPRVLGWFPGGPAAALAADLRDLKTRTEPLKGDVPAICQSFADAVTSRRIRHNADPLLISQVSGTSKLVSGDGWRYSRKGGHCDAVYAAAGASWLARTAPSVGRPRVVIAS